jgi:mono/diheme cytochrome c family protein
MRIAFSLLFVVALAGCAKGSGSANGAASSSAAARNPASASDGATVYLANCSSCHQPDGKGVANAFPPLAGNPAVTGSPIALIGIVKNGLEGRLVVHGIAYSGIMPSWKNQLSDDQLASVITYVRSAWNNNASAVSPAQVQAVK